MVTPLLISLPFAAMLVAVARADLDRRIVPNRILATGAAWAVAASVLVRPEALAELAIAAAAAFLALLAVALARPGGMGLGDVKLAGVMGLFLGEAVAVALLVAFLAGSVVGIGLVARDGREAGKRALPFAPFLALGGLAGMVAGPELVELYVTRLV